MSLLTSLQRQGAGRRRATIVVNSLENNEKLTQDQIALLKEIQNQFCTDENEADLGILYEVTGF